MQGCCRGPLQPAPSLPCSDEAAALREKLRLECSRAFREARAGGGGLSREDYKVASLSLLGYKPSKREVASVWGRLGAEEMKEEELVSTMLPRLLSQDQDDFIRQVFLAMDTHCHGYLTLLDCQTVFGQVAPHVGGAELRRLFREVDSNSDGRVSCRDFELLLRPRPHHTNPCMCSATPPAALGCSLPQDTHTQRKLLNV